MKANELRIGNWVNYTDERITGEVEFSKDMFDYIEFETDLEPIPLTEEWLIKFGFWRDGWTWYHESLNKEDRDDPKWQLNWSSDIFYIDAPCIHDGGFSFECLFVHTLQNAWYILNNGEELTITND